MFKNSKSVRLQVLLEPELYSDLFTTLKETKAPYKTDSEGVRYALQQFLNYENNVKLTLYAMKQQLDKQKDQIEADIKKIEALQADNNRLFTEKQQLEITTEQLQKKIKGVKNENRSKQGKKRSK